MIYLYAFLFGGLICGIAQIIMNTFKLTVGHMTTLFVCIGAVLDFGNFYDKLIEVAGAGALLPITSFGHSLVHASLDAARESGNERAALAIDMVAYRVKKYVGSYIAALGGVDAIVFTGGIGEHSPLVRSLVMEGMDFCGAKFDETKNKEYSSGVGYLNTDDSKVKIIVLPTNEELSIARETRDLTSK